LGWGGEPSRGWEGGGGVFVEWGGGGDVAVGWTGRCGGGGG